MARRLVVAVLLTVAALLGPALSPARPGQALVADPVLVAVGDMSPDPKYPHLGGQDDHATAALAEQVNPTVVAPLGDVQYEFGRLAAFTHPDGYVASWGRPAILGRSCPVAGNHEYWETPGASGFMTFFADRLAACSTSGRPDQGFYAYDLGAWRIYALSSDCGRTKPYTSPLCGPTSEQVRWLKADLAANPRRCVLAYWHHPRWGNYFPDDARVQDFWRALTDAHGDVVLVGHEHGYARFGSVDRDGKPVGLGAGIRQLVVGTGGRSLLPYTTPPRAGTIVRDDQNYGVLKVTLRPTGYTTSFRTTGGPVLDAHSAGCWA